jgi:TonB-linked SusC/RagA family outer membrane protein
MRKFLSLLAVLVLVVVSASAQTRKVSGVIQDQLGSPVPFASISLKGTNTGVTADLEGKFTIEAATGQTLVISAAGFEALEQVIADGAVTVSLKGNTAMREVVVTALGISKTKRSLGYSAQSVSPEEFNKVRPTDIASALAGKVAGVQLLGTPTSNFGEGQLRLRGISNLGGADPIYLVDGTIVALSAINLDEVENITVLKGPSATAIYGVRASGGAVEITLKKGSRKKPSVSINSLTEFGKVSLLPDYQNEYGGGYTQDWETFSFNPAVHPASWAAFDGQKLVEYGADESWGPKLDGTLVREWFSWYPGDDFGKLTPFSPQPNNVKDFYVASKRHNHAIAFDGGNDFATYRMSYNYRYTALPFPNTKRTENLFALRGSLKLTPKLTVSSNINFSVLDQLGDRTEGYTNDGQNISQNFNQWWQRQINMDKLRDYKNPAGGYKTWNIRSPIDTRPAYWDNIYYQVYESFRRAWSNRIFGDMSVSYQILPDLKATATARLSMLNYGGDGRIASYGLELPMYSINNGQFSEMNYEGRVDYTKRLKDFGVRASVGSNFMNQNRKHNGANTVGGLSVPELYSITASVDRPGVSNTWLDYRINSVYGNATFDWKNMVFIDMTVRNDWVSSLPKGNNSFTYPSIAASVIFTDIINSPGLKNILNYGKIRAAYGRSGVAPDAYVLNATYGLGTPYTSNPTMSIPTTVYDQGLQPSLSKEFEIGTELQFFKNRFNIDFAMYRKDGLDQILGLTVTPSSGSNTVYINAGLIRSEGWDLVMGVTPIRTRDFKWDIQFNVSKNRSKVIDLDTARGLRNVNLGTAAFGASVNARVGQEYGMFVGTRQLMDEKTGLPVITAAGNWTRQTSQLLGGVLPDYMGGAVTTMTYKNFSLTGTFTFQQGGLFFSTTRMFNLYSGLTTETVGLNDKGNPKRDAVADGGGIKVEGVLANGTPHTVYVDAQTYYGNLQGFHTPFLQKATYVKLSELKVGYTIRAGKLIKGMRDANIAFIVRNPWLIYAPAKDWGIDPSELENGNAFYEGGQLPQVRSYGINLNFGF